MSRISKVSESFKKFRTYIWTYVPILSLTFTTIALVISIISMKLSEKGLFKAKVGNIKADLALDETDEIQDKII